MTTTSRRVAALAARAVSRASRLARELQGAMLASEAGTLHKADFSPVTVADFAAQATVYLELERGLPPDIPLRFVGEEGASDLRLPENRTLLEQVVDGVRKALPAREEAGEVAVTPEDVLRALGRASFDPMTDDDPSPELRRPYFILDPVDGTKGFLRGPDHQFAVGLALVDCGRPVLGVIGCPNLPFPSVHAPPGVVGTLAVAERDHGAWMYPLPDEDPPALHSPLEPLESLFPGAVRLVVRSAEDAADILSCESFESGHSRHDVSSAIRAALGIRREPLQLDSMCKYVLVARGDVHLYHRLPFAGYEEKVWDHAPGVVVVEEAGGVVTDMRGAPLDFTAGRKLSRNEGVVAASDPALHAATIDVARGML